MHTFLFATLIIASSVSTSDTLSCSSSNYYQPQSEPLYRITSYSNHSVYHFDNKKTSDSALTKQSSNEASHRPQSLALLDKILLSFPNVLGMIGGLIGILTFVLMYLLPFKPRIFLGRTAFASTEKESHHIGSMARLNSFVCSLGIGNHRNKYGSILDFAVRIYKADSINPDNAVYFVSYILEKLPSSIEDIENEVGKTLFSPLNVLPKSERSLNLEFSEVQNRSTMSISVEDYLFLELYYQLRPTRPWKLVRTYTLAPDKNDVPNKKLVKYNILESYISRGLIKKSIGPTKTTIYHSASHKYILRLLRVLRYYLFFKPRNTLLNVILSIPFLIKRLFTLTYDSLVRIPIVKKSALAINRLHVTVGRPDLVPRTKMGFDKIYDVLDKQVALINQLAEDKARILLSRNGNKIDLSRNKTTVTFYVSGDGHITAQDSTERLNPTVQFNIELKESLFGRKNWYLAGGGEISIRSFALKVLDVFVFLSGS